MLNYSLVLVQKLDQGSLFDYFTVHDLSLDRRELDWFLSAICKRYTSTKGISFKVKKK